MSKTTFSSPDIFKTTSSRQFASSILCYTFKCAGSTTFVGCKELMWGCKHLKDKAIKQEMEVVGMPKVTREELVQIYRKVKQYIFAQTNRPRLFKILEFEKDIDNKLNRIMATLNNELESGKVPFDFVTMCEGICAIPHRVDNGKRRAEDCRVLVAGHNECVNSLDIDTIYTRVLADIPIECEIVFALWISRVGHLVDSRFGDCVWGNRLERMSNGDFSSITPSLYRFYLRDKRKWHEEVSRRAKDFLADKHKILVIASELRDRAIFSAWESITESDLGIDLVLKGNDPRHIEAVRQNEQLTRLVLDMLRHWRKNAFLVPNGIPIGAIISGILLNVRLLRFDDAMRSYDGWGVLYYGRCEKSFAIIVEDKVNVTTEKVFLCAKSLAEACFSLEKDTGADNGDAKSLKTAAFHRSRSRVLRLNSTAGRNLLAVFEHAMDEDRRVWQNLPEAPDAEDYVENMYSLFGRVEDEPGLLNINQPMLSRRHFTKQIQDMEQYLLFLGRDDWQKQRMAFLNAAKDMLTDVSAFVLYYSLFPRLLAIAFATAEDMMSSEFTIAKEIIGLIGSYLHGIPRSVYPGEDKQEERECLDKSLKKAFGMCVLERLCATVRAESEVEIRKRNAMIKQLAQAFPDLFVFKEEQLHTWRSMLEADLAHKSFAEHIFERRWHGEAVSCAEDQMSEMIPDNIRGAFQKVWNQIVSPICDSDGHDNACQQVPPSALYFATRPLDVTDLYAIGNCPGSQVSLTDIQKVLRVFNCKIPVNSLPALQTYASEDEDAIDDVIVPYRFAATRRDVADAPGNKFRVALVSWKVEEDSWVAMACDTTDPFRCNRFKRLMQVVNRILSMDSADSPHYLIFPELAMPPELFMRVAKKLARKGVSLIAGVDYLHCINVRGENRIVDNQVWCSLCCSPCDGLPVLYRYAKSEPALHETLELWSAAKAKYRCDGTTPIRSLVVSHGDESLNVCFSVLICSDLLDVKRRAVLRGRIDLLVVPAWNQDVKTYSALVDAAAYDIHTYVAQCNSRIYGDTRLRSPAKAEHLRDVVRLRGGRDDFFVIGELDVRLLRRFQSGHKSCGGVFKPCPIGFRIDEKRRMLPLLLGTVVN